MDELKTKLKEMIVKELRLLNITPESIDDAAPLFGEGLGLDSLDAVELVVLINKHFGVQISDMDEGKEAFRSIESLAKFIKKEQNNVVSD